MTPGTSNYPFTIHCEREATPYISPTTINDGFVPSSDEEEDNWSDVPSINKDGSRLVNQNSPGNELFSSTDSDNDILENIKRLRNINRKRPIIGYLNINILPTNSTKLDKLLMKNSLTFSLSLKPKSTAHLVTISAEGYKMHRHDRNAHGGRIMTCMSRSPHQM